MLDRPHPDPGHALVRLPDGRRLAFAEAGDPNGPPVLLFHGVPGSRLSALAQAPGAGDVPLRLIGLDRPGIGLSDPLPGRRLLDWPADVAAFADTLGLARFSVLGGSGGGPYALSCAHVLPARLDRVVLVNAMAPLDRPGALSGYGPIHRFAWWSLRHVPFQAAAVAWLQSRSARGDPELLVRRMAKRMAEADRDLLRDPAIRKTLARQMGEAFRQGWRGVARELDLLAGPWGFRPRDIAVRVHLWQGGGDRNVPPAMGRYLAREIPDCVARIADGAGHMLHGHQHEIVEVLLGAPAPTIDPEKTPDDPR